MADQGLKKLNRKELLEMLIALQNENEQLKKHLQQQGAQLQQQKAQLQNRDVQMQNAGSMAEAVLALNGIFESADRAAMEYLGNMQQYQKGVYDWVVADAQQKAQGILDNAMSERHRIIEEANAYLNQVRIYVEEYYKTYPELLAFASAQAEIGIE